MQRFMQGEARLCLVRNPLGIYPLLLSSLSLAGATLEFKHTIDGVHFSPCQQVTLVGVDTRIAFLLRDVRASVVWLDVSFLGLSFVSPLDIGIEELRAELGV